MFDREELDLTSLGLENVRSTTDLIAVLGKIREAIKTVDQNSAEGRAVADKAAADVRKALDALNKFETDQAAFSRSIVDGKESDLRRFVDPDGQVVWKSGSRSVAFGGRQVEVAEVGLLDQRGAVCDWHSDFKHAVTRLNLARMAMRSANPRLPRLESEVLRLATMAPAEIRPALERAFTSASGSGAEWIPQGFIPDLYEAFEVPRGIAGLFDTVEVDTETFKRPKVANQIRPYIKGEITNDDPAKYTASTPSTSENSITVKGLAARVLADDATMEDSAIAAEAMIRRLILLALDNGVEDAIINGDTAASHQDTIATWNIRSQWGSTGLGGSADHRRLWIGLRARAYDVSNTTDQGSAQTFTGIVTGQQTLGERALSRLVHIVSPEVLVKMMLMDEFKTAYALGEPATNKVGARALMMVGGVPVYVSRYIGADLAATGLYTGSGAKSGILTVDLSGFVMYRRRSAVVELDKQIASGHIEIVATLREVLDSNDGAGIKNVHFGYNWL